MKKGLLHTKRHLFFYGFVVLFLTPFTAFAAEDYKLLEPLPGVGTTDGSVAFNDYIQGIYNFGIWTVAIAALLMLTIGGFWYLTSAGNQARAGTAKNIIRDALLGLIVALFAWLLLYTINPDLIKVTLDPSAIQSDDSNNTTNPPLPRKDVTGQFCEAQAVGGGYDGRFVTCYPSQKECVDDVGDEALCIPAEDITKNRPYCIVTEGSGMRCWSERSDCEANANDLNPCVYAGADPNAVPDEQEARKKATEKGIAINKLACAPGQTSNCTNVAGMPDVVFDDLAKVENECGCQITITGGTESKLHGNHGKDKTLHGPGNPVFDVNKSAQTDAYFNTHKGSSIGKTKKGEPIYRIKSGALSGAEVIFESDHYHVNLCKITKTACKAYN